MRVDPFAPVVSSILDLRPMRRDRPCALAVRPRRAPGQYGVGAWRVYHFPDHDAREAFAVVWQHDLELRIP